jgi:hypothetical protein
MGGNECAVTRYVYIEAEDEQVKEAENEENIGCKRLVAASAFLRCFLLVTAMVTSSQVQNVHIARICPILFRWLSQHQYFRSSHLPPNDPSD